MGSEQEIENSDIYMLTMLEFILQTSDLTLL